jgi:hypothetical protein
MQRHLGMVVRCAEAFERGNRVAALIQRPGRHDPEAGVDQEPAGAQALSALGQQPPGPAPHWRSASQTMRQLRARASKTGSWRSRARRWKWPPAPAGRRGTDGPASASLPQRVLRGGVGGAAIGAESACIAAGEQIKAEIRAVAGGGGADARQPLPKDRWPIRWLQSVHALRAFDLTTWPSIENGSGSGVGFPICIEHG